LRVKSFEKDEEAHAFFRNKKPKLFTLHF